MIKNLTQLEIVVNEKVGRFLLDQDTTTIIAKEMCVQFLKYISQIEDQAAALKVQKETEPEIKQEEPKQE